MAIRPFRVDIKEDVLTDLRERLKRTRWPDEIEDSAWDYGSNLTYMRELCEYWADGFDWRAQEEQINQLPHFRADVDGLGIHFIHARGAGPDPIPLVITHGWPSTFAEMLKIIPLLSDPASHGADAADSFDVIVPSMPGYGFSDRPSQRGMSPQRISALWHKLMTEGLGYDGFVAQGGDWGAQVTTTLGLEYSENVRGIHLTMAGGGSPIPDDADLSVWTSASHQAADTRIRAERLSGRSSRVDSREMAHLERLRRRHRVPLLKGRASHASHHILGNADHQLIRETVLRKRAGPFHPVAG